MKSVKKKFNISAYIKSKVWKHVQTGDRDDADSVQEFGDWVGDKHSFH